MSAHFVTVLRIYGSTEVPVSVHVCHCSIGSDHDRYGR